MKKNIYLCVELKESGKVTYTGADGAPRTRWGSNVPVIVTKDRLDTVKTSKPIESVTLFEGGSKRTLRRQQ